MRIGTILLGFLELASAECVSLSTRVTRVNQHPVDTRENPHPVDSLCLPSKQRVFRKSEPTSG